MTETPSQPDNSTLSAMPPEQRFDYFVEQVNVSAEIWALSEEQDWLVLSADGEEFLPVWPSAELASAWAGSNNPQVKPKAIALETWLERWAPGMEQDGLMLAVFPGDDPDGVVIGAAELKAALLGQD